MALVVRTGSWTGPPRKIRARTPLTPKTVESTITDWNHVRLGIRLVVRCMVTYTLHPKDPQ